MMMVMLVMPMATISTKMLEKWEVFERKKSFGCLKKLLKCLQKLNNVVRILKSYHFLIFETFVKMLASLTFVKMLATVTFVKMLASITFVKMLASLTFVKMLASITFVKKLWHP